MQPALGISWRDYPYELVDIYAKGTLAEVQEALRQKVLFEGTSTPYTGEWQTPLTIAAKYNPDPRVIEAVAKAGFDVNQETSSGWSPLLMALVYNNPQVAARLSELGAKLSDINQPNVEENDDYTPIMLACHVQNREAVVTLLELGAALDHRSSMYGHTALMLASEWLDAEIVRMLLEAGAEVDVRDTDGKTALHYALRGGAENIRVLLEFGADVNAQARNGYTPLTYLASQAAPDPEMVEVLQAAGGFVNHHALVKERVDEILTLFMFGGADTIASDYIHPVARRNVLYSGGSEEGMYQGLAAYGRRVSRWEITQIVLNRDETEATVTVRHLGDIMDATWTLWKHGEEWFVADIRY